MARSVSEDDRRPEGENVCRQKLEEEYLEMEPIRGAPGRMYGGLLLF